MMGLSLAIDWLEGSPTLSSVLILLIFLVDSVQLCVIVMLETESFSSDCQSTCVGLIFVIAYFSRFFVTFLIGTLNEMNMHPLAACSLIMLLITLPCVGMLK